MYRFALAMAPLALLLACADEAAVHTSEDASPASTAPATIAPAGNGPDQSEMPMPMVDGVDSLAFSGSYIFTGLDGSRSTLTIDQDAGTYTYQSPAGFTEGRYRRLDAGRITIEDLDGRIGYFSVAPGALYRLDGAASPYDEIDPGRLYRQVPPMKEVPLQTADGNTGSQVSAPR